MRRSCIVAITSLLLSHTGAVPAADGPGTQAAHTPHRIILTWDGDPARTQAVTWRTEAPTTSALAEVAPASHGPKFPDTVQVAARSEALETTPGGPVVHYHTARFENLEPSTRYAYRVGDGVVWSEWNHFDTAAAEFQPFSFIYLGDAQNDVKALWSRVVREGFKHHSDARFLLQAGDLINLPNVDREWGDWFEAAGWINRRLPSIATPGNHEYAFVGRDQPRVLSRFWRPQFEFPLNGPAEFPETVYYLDYQGVRFISLDSNRDPEAQSPWLEGVLKDNPNRWTIVTHHHPVYSTAVRRDNPEVRANWGPLYDKYKVDLVLQGHDHTYGRTKGLVANAVVGQSEQGTVYIVSVSGPKMYDTSTSTRELMSRRAEDTQLYQVIKVEMDRLVYEAHTAGGELYDAFELEKLPGGGSRLVEKIPATPERLRRRGQ